MKKGYAVPSKLAIAVAIACNVGAAMAANNVVSNTDGSHTFYEAQAGCVYHYAPGNHNLGPFCDPATLNQVSNLDAQGNVVIGDNSQIFAVNGWGIRGNTLIGDNAHMGVAVDGGGQYYDPANSIGIGSQVQVYGFENVALGTGAKANGQTNVAIGSAALAGYSDYFTPVYTIGSTAIGSGAISYGNHSVAIGSNSVASDDYTVSFGNTTTRRRLTNVADAVGNYDAVNYGQMRAITDAMSTQITNLDGRITVLESAAPGGGGGGAVDLTPAYQYTDASSSQTLNSANAYTDASSAQTLNSANSYTDASSAQTLNSANAYTDAAVAGVVGEANAYTDREIAKSEKFLSAGIAAVAAQPSMPALSVGQKTVAVGTGHFNGANAVGVAFGFAPRDGVVLSGGVSGVSGEGKPVFRTSASYVW
jgi:autotransporter adhesin